jgi:signal peptidase I
VLIGLVGAFLVARQWVVSAYQITSSSMESTLHCGKPGLGCEGGSSDRVLACRICLDFSGPSRGQIVAFHAPPSAASQCAEGDTLIKRVIGLPGETVHEDEQGLISTRGPNSTTFVTLRHQYVLRQARFDDTAHFDHTWHVPKGQYFVMGDNRGESCDSRSWGGVPREDMIGVIFAIYWPPDRIGPG